ncbi:MAG: DUF302 domain-containing protein [Betaproteobacteria bacterium]|nr:DUF302 domain-containing protein [Betaproteobacteria bacterium]
MSTIRAIVIAAGIGAVATPVAGAENPALWKHHVSGNYDQVLAAVKAGLEARQFQILSEENLARGLENNRQVFGEDKWNTIGFGNVTAVQFCSLAFNHQVFNIKMDWSVLCPFKVVVYNLQAAPGQVQIVLTRPSWILARDPHPKARQVGKEIESRITAAIREGTAP